MKLLCFGWINSIKWDCFSFPLPSSKASICHETVTVLIRKVLLRNLSWQCSGWVCRVWGGGWKEKRSSASFLHGTFSAGNQQCLEVSNISPCCACTVRPCELWLNTAPLFAGRTWATVGELYLSQGGGRVCTGSCMLLRDLNCFFVLPSS